MQGVGKGTYSTRVAEALGMVHISAGDLVRLEMRKGTILGQLMAESVNKGNLLADQLILDVLQKRFQVEEEAGIDKFLLDGFPRTVAQAVALEDIVDVQMALNLDLREEVLIDKCLGRRLCTKCGKNYNVADINLPPSGARPAIRMPPLSPPPECKGYLETRSDDNEGTIRRRLEVYKASAEPIENFYRQRGKLIDFEITGGIPQTLPVLMDVLGPAAGRLQYGCGSGNQKMKAAMA